MSKIQKTAFLQNLQDIDAFENEEGITSKYFNITDIPLELPMGKSSMLIMGSKFLKNDVVLKLELTDSLGNPVYLEPVYDYEESGGVRVGIEVYKNTAAGSATLTILGELDPAEFDGVIPPEFQGIYNVKYTRPLTINKTIANDRPIRFYKKPEVNVTEIIKGQVSLTSTSTGSNVQNVGFIEGFPVPNTEGNQFTIDGDNFGEVQSYNDQVYGFSPIGNYESYDTSDPRYTFKIGNADFSSSMVGGTLTISQPNAITPFQTSSNTVVPPYSSRITKVINKKTIEVQKPFGVYDSGSGFYRIAGIGSGSYQINWPKEHEYDTSSINFKSFADVRLKKLRTFSGDINRVAAYIKNNGPFSNWQKVIDTPVESPELLLDPTSMTGTSRIGVFSSDSVINTYWTATGGQFGTETSATVQTFSDNEYLSDSVFVSASAASMLDDDSNEWIKLQLKSNYSMNFIEDTEYRIKAKLFCDNTNGLQNSVKAVFHMSGSAFGMSPSLSDSNYGRAIAKVQFDNIANKTDQQDLEATFVPDSSGNAILQVRFTGGHWHMSQVSIKPNSDTNFSPEFIRLIAPVPPLQTRPDNLDFAFEFYDINNNKAKTVLTTIPDNPNGVEFAGENMNILGDDNMIGGSVFVGGDAIGAGIQFGGVNSTLPETGESAAEG